MTKMAVIEFEGDSYSIIIEDNERTNLEAGELVICETRDGYVTVGRAVVPSFYADNPENYARNYGRQIIDTDLIGVYKCDLWKRTEEQQS